MHWSRLARRSRDDRGQAVIEFALVLPLLAFVIFGAAQLAQATNYWEQANHMANETARWAAVNRLPAYNNVCGSASANTAPTADDYRNYMRNELCVLNFGPNAAKSLCVNWSPATPTIGDDVTVNVNLTWPIPLVHNLTSFMGFGNGAGSLAIHGDSTMRLEQVPSSAAGAGCA
jgi:Flp pilus assembly protein TadG